MSNDFVEKLHLDHAAKTQPKPGMSAEEIAEKEAFHAAEEKKREEWMAAHPGEPLKDYYAQLNKPNTVPLPGTAEQSGWKMENGKWVKA